MTVIPAASFTSDDHYVTDYGSLFRYFPFSGSHRLYYAGLSEIPAGAVIDYVGLECASTGTGELTVTPFYADESSGATSGIVALQNTPHSYGLDYNDDYRHLPYVAALEDGELQRSYAVNPQV